MPHEQTMVKVNAQVDRGIAPLVEALNRFPEVQTVSSCEGGDGREAYVAFAVGDNWQTIGEFIERLSMALGEDESLSDTTFSLSIEWYAGGGTPTGYLRAPRQHIHVLAESIRSVASDG